MLTFYEFSTALLYARVRTERGANLVEYALLIALIAIVCAAAVASLGRDTKSTFSSITTAF